MRAASEEHDRSAQKRPLRPQAPPARAVDHCHLAPCAVSSLRERLCGAAQGAPADLPHRTIRPARRQVAVAYVSSYPLHGIRGYPRQELETLRRVSTSQRHRPDFASRRIALKRRFGRTLSDSTALFRRGHSAVLLYSQGPGANAHRRLGYEAPAIRPSDSQLYCAQERARYALLRSSLDHNSSVCHVAIALPSTRGAANSSPSDSRIAEYRINRSGCARPAQPECWIRRVTAPLLLRRL